MRLNRRQMLGVAAASPWLHAVQAQDYPVRPVRVVVPVPPGGLTDTLARSLAQRLNASFGQSFIVENKPGAGSIIGTDYVLKQPADGHTLLFTWTAIVQNPLMNSATSYDPVKDFVPVARVGGISALFAAGSHLKVSNLQEFVTLAKTAPRPISYGTPGIGSAAHFYGEILARAMGITMNHVPYKGDADMLPDLLNHRVDTVFIQPVSVLQHAAEGRVRLLAAIGPQRIALLPQVPTFSELGVAGLDDDRWFGLFMRAGTPPAIIDRISLEVGRWVAMPTTQQRMLAAAMDPGAQNSAEFTASVTRSQQQWRDIVRRVPIKLQ